MLITDITISDCHYRKDTADHAARVSLGIANQAITLFCRIDLPEQVDAGQRAQAFVQDAMRQLRRMPEFRSGRQELQLDKNLRPELA